MPLIKPGKDLDPRFQETIFLVEANSYEQLALWREHHDKGKVPWREDLSGIGTTIGHLNKRPVCISFTWSRIYEQLVCFYDPMSQLVDYVMVEEYLSLLPIPKANGRNAKCDAMNFGHCLMHCKELFENNPITIGDIVRYDKGPTALMRLEEISRNHGGDGVNRYYGTQCTSGSDVGSYEIFKATKEDLKTWKKYHPRK